MMPDLAPTFAVAVPPVEPAAGPRRRLAVLNSHPIQYFAPLYRRLAREPWLDLVVYFCSRAGLEPARDAGFGVRFAWDIPLLGGYRAEFLPNWSRRDGIAGFFGLVNPGIVRVLRRERFDALWLHGHNHCTYLLAFAAARLTGTPVLMRSETHLGLPGRGLRGHLRGPLKRWLYRQCAACLPIGSANAVFYRAHGVAPERLFPVPYTVDNAYFRTAVARERERREVVRAELGWDADRVVVLYASKLSARKRPSDLLAAYARVRRDRPRAALLFVGSGSEEAALRRQAAQEGIPDVVLAGFRNQSELPRLYAAADVFVLPAEHEPWGLVINEAMCADLPVVATREIGAVADLVADGDNGLLYTAGDIGGLAAALARLVDDDGLRRRMSARSAARIASWSYEQCVAGVRDALNAVARR